MPRNIEIKAKIGDLEEFKNLAKAASDQSGTKVSFIPPRYCIFFAE